MVSHRIGIDRIFFWYNLLVLPHVFARMEIKASSRTNSLGTGNGRSNNEYDDITWNDDDNACSNDSNNDKSYSNKDRDNSRSHNNNIITPRRYDNNNKTEKFYDNKIMMKIFMNIKIIT